MILDEVVLHNFGVYAGRQHIELAPPRSDQPIVLFGGLNGGGKTTLLDALQLGLYGKRARCSNRGSLAYDEFLRRSIHHGVPPHEGAAVEVQFRHFENGQEHVYRVHRSWAAPGSTIRERVEVLLDGQPDAALTESWDEHMEDVLPSRIAHLFFFDGEQIEAFADGESASQLLTTAVNSLLGLDMVDQLRADLIVIERRKRVDGSSKEDRRAVDAVNGDLERIRKARAKLVEALAGTQTELDRAKKRLAAAEEKLKQAGGDLFERRAELEAQRDNAARSLDDAETALRDFAAGPAPLLLCQGLLTTALKQASNEEAGSDAKRLYDLLKERDAKVLRAAAASKVAKKSLDAVRSILDEDRRSRRPDTKARRYLNLSNEAVDTLRHLIVNDMPALRGSGEKLCFRADEARQRVDEVDRLLVGVPHPDAVAALVATRAEELAKVTDLSARVEAYDVEIKRVSAEHERVVAKLERELARLGDTRLASDDSARVLTHSSKVRDTLDRFRNAMVRRHVSRIEKLVFESFGYLLRKDSLVSGLRIDPTSLTLTLLGANQTVLTPERLSAGERQLLGVSLLWGLARASGRPLPAIIDTPLGRLDSAHRANLLERYLPAASHQVLVLSTDQEIDQRSFERISKRVGRSYRLDFDNRSQSTTVRPGYFWS